MHVVTRCERWANSNVTSRSVRCRRAPALRTSWSASHALLGPRAWRHACHRGSEAASAASVARSLYSRLPDSAQLWQARDTFVAVVRDRIVAAFGWRASGQASPNAPEGAEWR